MKAVRIDPANGLCGAIFIGTGAFFAAQASALGIGSALQMGSGFFPMLLSVVLIGLGLLLVLRALRTEGEPIGQFAVRGMLLILPSPIVFGLTINTLGFMPALFMTCFVACFASVRMSVAMAVLVSAVVTVFSIVVFSYALGLPYPLLGTWLDFH
jgi:hypothetical protein